MAEVEPNVAQLARSPGTPRPKRKAQTSEEKKAKIGEKRVAAAAAVDASAAANWKLVPQLANGNFQMCFNTPNEQPPANFFMTFKQRSTVDLSFADIFVQMMTDSIMDKLFDEFPLEELRFKIRHTRGHEGQSGGMRLCLGYMWQSVCVTIRITGFNKSSKYGDGCKEPMKAALAEARAHFTKASKSDSSSRAPAGREIILRLASRMLMTEPFCELLAANCADMVLRLGQFVAGDEKLFHYTGESGLVRLVPSKPDKIGLWFYELCGCLANGLAFCLFIMLHNSIQQKLTTVSVVSKWVANMRRIDLGADADADAVWYPHTVLVFDSYYTSKEVIEMFDQEQNKRVCYLASVTPDRFANLTRFLLPPGYVDEEGASKAAYNEVLKELYVFHWDTQKGVGKKFNFSRGLIPCSDKSKVSAKKFEIPGYDTYKTSFACCDDFNKGLHDKVWPHKRGGNGHKGFEGKINDFIMACMLQNTYNAWHQITGTVPHIISFQQFCCTLADQLWKLKCNDPTSYYQGSTRL